MSADATSNSPLELFVVLDLDRTLIDSTALTQVLVEYLVPSQDREREIASIERHRGGSYDALTYLMKQYPRPTPLAATELTAKYGWKNLADTLLLPGAADVFQALDSRKIPYGIFTKGGLQFQTLKVALLCAMVGESSIPFLVTNSAQKASYIAKHWWSDESQTFTVPAQLTSGPELQVRRVVVVDDKLENLISSHGGITPYHVSVNTVATFIDSIDHIITN